MSARAMLYLSVAVGMASTILAREGPDCPSDPYVSALSSMTSGMD